jgi:solute carrier family 25 folate transporter 32
MTYAKGALDATRRIWRAEGWRAFYNGLSPSLIGAGVAWGSYFYLYEGIKGVYSSLEGSKRGVKLSPWWHTLSAAQAGLLVSLVTNPIWLVKTRLTLQQSSARHKVDLIAPSSSPSSSAQVLPARQYKGMADALVRIGKEEGLRGYFKGLGPSLILQTSHGAIQFTAYEELKHWLSPNKSPSSLETSICAVLSKLVATLATYPAQVVRSRVHQRQPSSLDTPSTSQQGTPLNVSESSAVPSYRGSWEATKSTFRNEGVSGFYKGIGPGLLRVLPQSALTMTLYEGALRLLRDL